MCVAGKRDTIGAPYPQVSHLKIQLRIKNIQKKINPRKFQKVKLDFATC